jgi:hypothetical protein
MISMSGARNAPVTTDWNAVCSLVVPKCCILCSPFSFPLTVTAAAPTPPSRIYGR